MSAGSPLLERYPLSGTVELSTGAAPAPYLVYDGLGVLVGGTASAGTVRGLLCGEALIPALNEAGRALVGLWLCDFRDASLGPHTEFQLSLFVTRAPAARLADGPFALPAALLARPDIEMLCYGLWNNTAQVVAYNAEHLALPARLMTGSMKHAGPGIELDWADADSQPLVRASLRRVSRSSMAANGAMLRQVGLRRIMALRRDGAIGMTVVSPVSTAFPANGRAQAFAHPRQTVLRAFDAGDQLTLSAPAARDLDFQPAFVQMMPGFRFVYLEPVFAA